MSHAPALSRQLADWAAGITIDTLPANVIAAMKVYILDDLAGALVGSYTPWGDMVVKLAQESASSGVCTVIGRTETSSPSYAAFANGTFIGGFETDHIYSTGSSHPSAGAFSAAFAAAESRHQSGAAFLAALAAGYETCCRVGFAATRAVEDVRGFHGPGTNSSFGAAVASAKLLGLDAAGVLNAMGIAGSHAGGLLEFHHEGSMTKRIHPGRGSQMGYECAVLASQGFTGPSTVLEGDSGFFHVYSPSPNPEQLTAGLGERWHLLGIMIKSFPCHVTCQSMVEGVWKGYKSGAFDPAKVTKVVVRTGGRVLEDRFQDKAATTVMGAQYSMPFSTAIAAVADAGEARTFSQATVDDPKVRSMAQHVEVVETPGYGGAGQPTAEIEVVQDGAPSYKVTVTEWKGHPSNPFTFDEMADKFRRYAAGVLSAGRVDAVVEAVRNLEALEDVATLGALLSKG